MAQVSWWRRAHTRFGLASQVVSSTSNFTLGLVVGRFAGPDDLGAYGPAFLLWVVALLLYVALVTDPMVLVEADVRDDAALDRAARGAMAVGLGLAAAYLAVGAALVAFASADTGRAILTLGAVLPVLVVQDFVRRVAFADGRAEVAFWSDVAFFGTELVVLAALVVADAVTAVSAIAAWCAGAAVGLVLGQAMLRARVVRLPSLHGLRTYWSRGRSLASDLAVVLVSRYALLLSVAAMVPRADFGGYQAAQSLMGPIAVTLQAAGNLALPRSAQAYRGGGWPALHRVVRRIGTVVTSTQVAYCMAVVAFGPWLIQRLFGPEYEEFSEVVRLVALGQAVNLAAFGAVTAIKVLGGVHRLWPARMLAAIVALPVALAATAYGGIVGAAWGVALVAAVELVAKVGVYRVVVHEEVRLRPTAV